MRRTFCIILLLSVIAAGCLETKEAWPALVNEQILRGQGWVSAGDIQKQTQTIAGVKINMALMNYRDDALARDIREQVQRMSGLSPEQTNGASQFTSQLLTVRLVLPAGISLPSAVVNRVIGSQLEQIASQNNIRDFHEAGYTNTTLANEKEINIKNYDGYVDFEGGSIKIKGMTASWPDSGSTIMVFGVLPRESITVEPKNGDNLSIKIDGEQESYKIITLIQSVK